ncbi:hypothetical protein BJY52DRAFT_1236476 [Lactarius psammicola]|nr:hypothetical protein BJY52DRAFT_1236476 [Lactarius psammicola]
MSIAIGEPFLLSSYDIPWRELSRSSSHHGIYVTHGPSSAAKAKSREGFATVTVQGDGVHVLDISDSHVAGSYTLGPSTTFAGPSVSRIISENGTRFRRIYAAVEQSSGVRNEDHGRVIWLWDEASERDGRAKEQKSSITAPHRVSRIYAPEDLPNCVLLLSPGGDVTMMDIDLDTLKAKWRSNSKSSLLTSLMFPKVSATFLPPHLVAPLATLVLVLSSTGVIQVCVLSIYEDEIATVLNEEAPVDGTVIEASCSPSGYITCLQSDGQWRSFELHSMSPESLLLLPIHSPMRLSGLSFIEKSPGATASHHNAMTVSTLSLGSSFALLCGDLAQSQDIVVLLWDLRYSVVLASHRFPIPSNLTASKAGFSLKLIPASNTQVLLSLSSRPQGKSSKSRSAVFVIPVTVPATSTIATALGRASSSAKWLVATNGGPLSVSFSSDRHDLLNKLRSTIRQNNPEAADSAFFEWLENRSGSVAGVDDEPIFGHEFVREILDIVLQPSSTPASTSYPPKIMGYLLENRAVSAGILSQSLLELFIESKDWRAVALTLKNVLDIPEIEVIKLVRSIHGYHRPSGAHDMQVDATLSDAEVSSIVASCVSYPSSDAALRLAIKEQLNNAESIIPILLIIDDWLGKISSHKTSLESPGKTTTTVAGPEEADIPPLDKILAFLRAILDATFVTLLHHTQSHPLLRRLSARLQSEIKTIDELQLLHGPLELFARTQEKTTSEKQRPTGPLEDWRRRRKLAHEQASMGVGLYRVEELVI